MLPTHTYMYVYLLRSPVARSRNTSCMLSTCMLREKTRTHTHTHTHTGQTTATHTHTRVPSYTILHVYAYIHTYVHRYIHYLYIYCDTHAHPACSQPAYFARKQHSRTRTHARTHARTHRPDQCDTHTHTCVCVHTHTHTHRDTHTYSRIRKFLNAMPVYAQIYT